MTKSFEIRFEACICRGVFALLRKTRPWDTCVFPGRDLFFPHVFVLLFRAKGLNLFSSTGKSQRVITQRVTTSKNFAQEKMFAEDISEDFLEGRTYHLYWILEYSGYLRNLRRRLLSSEKFSEVFALWVFTQQQVAWLAMLVHVLECLLISWSRFSCDEARGT